MREKETYSRMQDPAFQCDSVKMKQSETSYFTSLMIRLSCDEGKDFFKEVEQAYTKLQSEIKCCKLLNISNILLFWILNFGIRICFVFRISIFGFNRFFIFIPNCYYAFDCNLVLVKDMIKKRRITNQ